jgi:death on curing protein
MQEPVWISEELTLKIHLYQLALHGGLAGIRDAGLISSALARPRHLLTFSSMKPDIARLAASYACGLAKNHPFVDGNKRTATAVMGTFVGLNNCRLSADDASLYTAMIQLADGTWSEEVFADWLRQHLQPA